MELFEQPIYFLYFFITVGVLGLVYWLGTKRKQHIIRCLFQADAFARLSGGGFGGISIHLVKEEQAQQYCERLETAYESMTGKKINTIICSIGDGAKIITE